MILQNYDSVEIVPYQHKTISVVFLANLKLENKLIIPYTFSGFPEDFSFNNLIASSFRVVPLTPDIILSVFSHLSILQRLASHLGDSIMYLISPIKYIKKN